MGSCAFLTGISFVVLLGGRVKEVEEVKWWFICIFKTSKLRIGLSNSKSKINFSCLLIDQSSSFLNHSFLAYHNLGINMGFSGPRDIRHGETLAVKDVSVKF